MSTEKSFKVAFAYTVWVEVDAADKEEALAKAHEVEYQFVDKNHTGAYITLDEYIAIVSVEKSFKVAFAHTVWVEVDAPTKEAALAKAHEVEYQFVDKNHTGAYIKLDEYTDPEVIELN